MQYNRILVRSLIILTVSVICLVSPLTAAVQDRPFKGRIVVQFVATPTANPFIFNEVANASGNATHVGRFTKVTSDTFNVVTGEVTGSFTMTAANGDLLTGHYVDYVIRGATTFSWNLDSTITGGTGRYANATGTFVFEEQGQYQIVGADIHGNYTETFNSTISY